MHSVGPPFVLSQILVHCMGRLLLFHLLPPAGKICFPEAPAPSPNDHFCNCFSLKISCSLDHSP